MNLRNKFLLFVVGLLFLSISFFSLNASKAQQNTSAIPSPTATPEIEEDDEPIKVDTEVVNILFTAQDKNRRLVTDLRQEDVRILENGQEQEITYFGRQVDLPLSLAILIDTSASQERTLPEIKSAAISFVDSVVRREKDEVAVVSFTGESTLEQGMTNNIQRLRRAIERVQFVPPSGYIGGGVVVGTPPISGRNQAVQGSTAMWDAIYITAEEVLGPAPEKTRRAMILLSDGVDTFSKKKLEDAVRAAEKAEAVVYSIGIGDNFYDGVDKGTLNKISERTGGRAFFPKDEAELRNAFTQIQIEMRSQYLIAYEPSNQKRDGSYRTVEIQVVNQNLIRQKVTLRHRKGYYAKNEAKSK